MTWSQDGLIFRAIGPSGTVYRLESLGRGIRVFADNVPVRFSYEGLDAAKAEAEDHERKWES